VTAGGPGSAIRGLTAAANYAEAAGVSISAPRDLEQQGDHAPGESTNGLSTLYWPARTSVDRPPILTREKSRQDAHSPLVSGFLALQPSVELWRVKPLPAYHLLGSIT